ncbi:hypothetical protein BH11ACT2_BH11ACT2_15000 [soil metagenome]
MVDPSTAFAMDDQSTFEQDYGVAPAQTLTVSGSVTTVDRDGFTITQAVIKKAEASAPDVAKPTSTVGDPGTADPSSASPGSAKAIAYDMVKARGWNDKQYSCLVALWNRESGWNVHASNGGSGAYGIPQALPGSKMGSAGPNWQSNAATQIKWGLGYIAGRYNNPCGAWASSESRGWY